jgi:hypothetical protein
VSGFRSNERTLVGGDSVAFDASVRRSAGELDFDSPATNQTETAKQQHQPQDPRFKNPRVTPLAQLPHILLP